MNVPDPLCVGRILPEHLDPESLSIVVFGPGEGEAIVVILPDGGVGVVDGCRSPRIRGSELGNGDPVREFLHAVERHRGLERHSLPLEFVCLTHPHTDHFRGLGQLMKAYDGRIKRTWRGPHGPRYAKELLEYDKLTRAGTKRLPDAVDPKGLKEIIDEFTQTTADGTIDTCVLCANKRLLRRQVQGETLEVWGCGPSDSDTITAQRFLGLKLMLLTSGDRDPRGPDPNQSSGALVVSWGESAILLGGDLLCGDGAARVGWTCAHEQIDFPVQVVNVAHHGSAGAHDSALWARMEPKLALITPFKYATDNYPPKRDDVRRLAETCKVAITSPPEWHTPKTLDGNGIIPVRVTSGHRDIYNAIAVSMGPDGQILSFVLAGEARLYET